jgi:hypothetical protein
MALPSAYSPPGVGNVFIPGFDDAVNLIVGYSRNEKEFPINQYCQIKTSSVYVGLYPKFDPQDLMRMSYTDVRNFLWRDGKPSPIGEGEWTNDRTGWITYNLERYRLPGSIGYQTQQQAVWDAKKKILDSLGHKAMIARTLQAITLATTAGEYPSSHVDTATNWGGGFWSAGTINSPNIGNSLAKIRSTILKDTAGKVKFNDLVLVVDPDLAYQMSLSQEIRAYLAQQAGSLKVLEGKDPGAEQWLLPTVLYGFKTVIEDTPYVSAIQDTAPASQTVSYILGSNNALVLTRPGGVDGDAGGSDFSTLMLLCYKDEEMLMETFDRPDHRLTDIYITDTYKFIIPAPESGVVVTHALS